MRKTHYYCDRCRKEVDEKELYNVTIYAVRADLITGEGNKVVIELCEDCLRELENVVKKEAV